jgi:hypothetical protein
MLRVTKATPVHGHVLEVEFNDGSAGQVDCEFLIGHGLGKDLGNPDYFRRVRVDDELATVVWPNGLDPAPELLRARLVAEVPSAA